ncbi:MAG: hypothetical protein AB7F86_09150 [Bdellovibrionales bacterium]
MNAYGRISYLVLFLIFSTKVLATQAPPEGSAWGSTEYALLGSSGSIDDQRMAHAVRLGASSHIVFPLNSSIEAGFMDEDRRRYVRLNLFAIGKQPQITRGEPVHLFLLDPYYRLEFASVLWAEGGPFAYTPAVEGGMSIRISDTWALSPGVRFSSTDGAMLERDSTMISFIVGFVQLVPPN